MMKQEYENICYILRENQERFPIYSLNLFDIKFFNMMCNEF